MLGHERFRPRFPSTTALAARLGGMRLEPLPELPGLLVRGAVKERLARGRLGVTVLAPKRDLPRVEVLLDPLVVLAEALAGQVAACRRLGLACEKTHKENLLVTGDLLKYMRAMASYQAKQRGASATLEDHDEVTRMYEALAPEDKALVGGPRTWLLRDQAIKSRSERWLDPPSVNGRAVCFR